MTRGLLASGSALVESAPLEDGPDERGPVRFGLMVLAVFALGFLGWATLLPLSSAAVAPGEVRVESHRKTVQHMEGGIVRGIFVREGDLVRAGQLLLRIDDTQSASALAGLRVQFAALKLREDRLVAEQDGSASFQCTDPAGRTDCVDEQKIFTDRHNALQGQTDILKQKIEQLGSEIAGRRAEITSLDAQLRTISEEIKSVQSLVSMQLIPRPRLLALQRQEAGLQGTRGEELALIARAEQGIDEAHMQISDLANKYQMETSSHLRDTREKLADIKEKLRAAADVQHRTDVIAPQDGKIVNLRVFTVGGVLKPGEPILDIVPQNDKLIVESKVRPIDIEAVHAGLNAEVRITTYRHGRAPTVIGTVKDVSADSIVDPRTGQSYYTALVEIDPRELRRVGDVKLYPGMPTMVLITTGQRTFMQYLFDPIRDSVSKAFREG